MKKYRHLLSQIGMLLILGIVFSLVASIKNVNGTASTTAERLQYLKERKINSENKLKTLKARREQLLKLLSSIKNNITLATTSTTTQKIIPIEVPPPVVPPTIPPIQVPPINPPTVKATTTNTTQTTTTKTTTLPPVQVPPTTPTTTTTTTKTTTTTTNTSSTNTSATNTNTTSTNTSTVPASNTFGTFGSTTILKPTVSSSAVSATYSGVAGKKVSYSINYTFPISYFTLEIKCDVNIKAYKYDSGGNPITSQDACGAKEKIVTSGGMSSYVIGYVNSEPTATPRQATITLQAFNSSDQIQGSTVSSSLYISK